MTILSRGRIALLSYVFLPMASGPAYVLEALLRQFDLSDTLVITGDAVKSRTISDTPSSVVCRRRVVDVPRWWPDADWDLAIGRGRARIRVRAAANVLTGLRVAARAMIELAHRDTKGIVVVYPTQHYVLGAVIASVITGKPLAIYFMDIYAEGLRSARRVGALIERSVLRRASVAFTMSEPLRQHIERRAREAGGSLRVVELPHAYLDHADVALTSEDELGGKPSLVFTGTIYDAQADALQRLIVALDDPAVEHLAPRLHVFSQTTPALARQYGVRASDRVSWRRSTRQESARAVRAADILFLPIAFLANQSIARTASPSKLPEYLAARRPILVHAPSDSYIARYAREHGFAYVVDQPDQRALAEAIARLAGDEDYAATLTANATRTLERHSPAHVAETFRAALSEAFERGSAA